MKLLSTRRRRRVALLVGSAAAVLVAAGAWTGASYAAGNHYYIEAGGTGSTVDAPACTSTYNAANDNLNGGIPVPVCYPASAGPFIGAHNEMPAPGAPSMDASVAQGVDAMMAAVEDRYHADSGAQFTIVGYSQGAWVADLVLQKIASGTTDIPKGQVNGMLYADPMQPGTGIWAKVPKGVSLAGITSPGPGPEHFDGVGVQRFCIHTDGICDATSIQSFGGYFVEHPKYPQAGGIMTQTIGAPGGDGVRWY